ncbi:hypothetical protein D3C71_1255320 [compost metagenome]
MRSGYSGRRHLKVNGELIFEIGIVSDKLEGICSVALTLLVGRRPRQRIRCVRRPFRNALYIIVIGTSGRIIDSYRKQKLLLGSKGDGSTRFNILLVLVGNLEERRAYNRQCDCRLRNKLSIGRLECNAVDAGLKLIGRPFKMPCHLVESNAEVVSRMRLSRAVDDGFNVIFDESLLYASIRTRRHILNGCLNIQFERLPGNMRTVRDALKYGDNRVRENIDLDIQPTVEIVQTAFILHLERQCISAR